MKAHFRENIDVLSPQGKAGETRRTPGGRAMEFCSSFKPWTGMAL